MSQQFVDKSRPVSGTVLNMTSALPPRVRSMIINFDPTQPDALSISEFCKTQKISRSIFYRLRRRAVSESAAALHPQSRAPRERARKYGPAVVNELVKIRQKLKRMVGTTVPKPFITKRRLTKTLSQAARFRLLLQSAAYWPASVTWTATIASVPNPLTFPSQGQRLWPCGNLMLLNTAQPKISSSPCPSSLMMPADSMLAPEHSTPRKQPGCSRSTRARHR